MMVAANSMTEMNRKRFSAKFLDDEHYCNSCGRLRWPSSSRTEESDRNHEMTIMKKMHETQLEVKNRLIKNLEDIIDEQEARIFNYESHLAGLRELSPSSKLPLKGVVRMADQIEALSAENVHLKSTLMQEQMDHSKIVQDISSNVTRIKELEELLNLKSEQAVTDTEKQLNRLEKDNRGLQETVSGLQEQVENLQASNADLQTKCDRLERKKNEAGTDSEQKESLLRQRLQESRSDNAALVAEIAILKSRLGQAETQSSQHRSQTEQSKAEMNGLEKKLRTAESQLSTLRDSLAELQCRKEALQVRLEDAEKELILGLKTVNENTKLMEELSTKHECEMEEMKLRISGTSAEADKVAKKHWNAVRGLTSIGSHLKNLRLEQNQMMDNVYEMQSEFHQSLVHLRQQLSRLVSDSMSGLVKKYKKEISQRKHYYNQLVELKGNIRVLSRVRPAEECVGQNVVEYDEVDDGAIYMLNASGRWQAFSIDRVFRPQHTQIHVFDEVKPVVATCIDGFNVCIFAYGQTGSGKTYTMEGPTDNPGISRRALIELFEESQARKPEWQFSIIVSMLEIYNEMIRDLLSEDPGSYKLEVKMHEEGGLHVPGLKQMEVTSTEDVLKIFALGKQNRATASTNLNEHSSRSHALLAVQVIGINRTAGLRSIGKLNLVDLAGSERVKKSDATGIQLKEAQCINKSLSALGDVISALKNKKPHVPYRNSKLTYLLQDSLGGDSKTMMIVQVAPEGYHMGESISSLSFAQRVRSVELGPPCAKLHAVNGQDSSDSDPGTFSRNGSKIYARSSQRGQPLNKR